MNVLPTSEGCESTLAKQRAAADPSLHSWVSACAGAGKTRVLIDRVARLLLTGVAPKSIMCLTYTNAAANEIAERLFDRLGTWCVLDDDSLRHALNELGAEDAQDTALARGLFADALETPGGLRIQTIHSFCASLLRRFPLEAGVPAGFTEIEQTQADDLRREAMEGLIRAGEQDAELARALRVVILAAGGRRLGDTVAELCTRRARFSKRLSEPGGLDTALAELRELLKPPPFESPDALYAGIMDSDAMPPRSDLERLSCALRDSGEKKNCDVAARIDAALDIDTASYQRYLAYRSIWLTGKGECRKSNPYTKTAASVDGLAELFSIEFPQGSETLRILDSDNAVRTHVCQERSAALLTVCAKLLQRYRLAKKRRGWLDFDDLIRDSFGLIARSHAADWVSWKLDGGIGHVLIDEAQDTSPEQWELLHALTAEFFSGRGSQKHGRRTMFVVGDQRQSIYSFHGAVPADFPEHRQKFVIRCADANATPELVSLDMSFRSAPEILTFVDAVSARISESLPHPPESPTPPPEMERRHRPSRTKTQGRVELWLPEYPDPEEKTSVKTELAGRIARYVADALERGEPVGDEPRPLEPEDVMILVRGRECGLFDALHAAFRNEGLPVVGADRLKLTNSPAVQDCLNLIRFALCPEDDLVLAELLTSPFCGLTEDAHLFPLAHGRGQCSLWSRLRDSPDLKPVRKFLDRVLELRHQPPFEFLCTILEHPVLSGGRTGREALFSRFGAPEQNPLDALTDAALAARESAGASLQRFLHTMDTENTDITADMTVSEQVRIMTVHAAKGAEAPMVILPDCASAPQHSRTGVIYSESGLPLWPDGSANDCQATRAARQKDTADRMEDHYRLLYVAMTRARDLLLVTGPRYGRGGAKGYAGTSWLAVCAEAMLQLCKSDQAHEYENVRFVLGRDQTRTDRDRNAEPASQPSPPDWLTLPAPSEPTRALWHRPSRPAGDTSRRAETARRRGRIVHDLLDRLCGLGAAERQATGERYLNRVHGDLEGAERSEIIQTVVKVFTDPECARIYEEGGRSEVPVVGRLISRSGSSLSYRGRIDRMIVTENKVSIIEVKTDRPAPGDPASVPEGYLEQLAAYALILAGAYPGHAVEAAFLWTDGPCLMPVGGDLIEAYRP